MNEAFINLAQKVFTSANGHGPSILPAGLEAALEHLGNEAHLASDALCALGQSLAEQFPFLRHRSLIGVQCDDAAYAEWEASVRAVLERLRAWFSEQSHAFEELSALLYSLDALGLDSVDVASLTKSLQSDELFDGLYTLVRNTEVTSFSPGHDRIPNADQEIKEASLQGNFVKIGHIVRYIMPAFNAAISSAVRLLWNFDSTKLAEAVTLKDSVYFALLVRLTLKDSFATLAAEVPLIWVKYFAVETLEEVHRRDGSSLNSVAPLQQLLLQVSDTPAWQGWMKALLAAPHADSLMCAALPGVLAALQESHWAGFIAAVSLGYSKRSAEPTASILASFYRQVDPLAAHMMWSMCFERWKDWNYGANERQFYMFSPAACAFDYPVAMYYSDMPSHERDAEEAALELAVECVEQQWFASGSDLITERNRLLSRLRLVVHGRRIARGDANLLPSDVQPPDTYSSVRYSYHDVQARP